MESDTHILVGTQIHSDDREEEKYDFGQVQRFWKWSKQFSDFRIFQIEKMGAKASERRIVVKPPDGSQEELSLDTLAFENPSSETHAILKR